MTLRYVEGLGMRPRAGGLEVIGGKQTIRLRSPDPAATLRTVELLRAGHPPDDVAVRLGLPVDTVRGQVASLARLGVLTDAAPPPGKRQLVRYLERTLGAETAAGALDRLARATVHIDGDAPARRLITDQLEACGVATTESGGSLAISCRPPSPTASPGGAAARPTLFVTMDGDSALVGPLCDVPGGRCHHCLRLPGRPSALTGVDSTATRVAVALAVGEAVRYLAGTGYCRTSAGAIRVRGDCRDQSFEPVARDARCRWCGWPELDLTGDAVAAYRSFQAADVPLKQNWSAPLLPVRAPHADGTITFHPLPAAGTAHDRALGIVAGVLGARGRRRRDRVPSIGGARFLNVFAAGLTEDGASCHYLDQHRVSIRPLPAAGLAQACLLRTGRLTVIVSAALSRAEYLFGQRAYLTAYQDTGFAVGAMWTALAASGFRPEVRPAPAGLPGGLTRALGLDPERDLVTAIVEVPDRRRAPARAGTVRPSGRPARRADLDAVLAPLAGGGADVYVRCYRVAGVDDGLHLLAPGGAGLRRVTLAPEAIDAALTGRGLDCGAVAVFTTHIGRALAERGATGINACVVEQSQSAQRAYQVARERGLDAAILADLPSTALAPDGRGWRTAYRSFAAVALAAPGAGGSVVCW
jgi:hypothetical protein